MAEDFADGVEEIDLLVAARQLVGEFSGFSLAIENHAEESGQIGAEDCGARLGDPGDFEPETFRGENGLRARLPHRCWGPGPAPGALPGSSRDRSR